MLGKHVCIYCFWVPLEKGRGSICKDVVYYLSSQQFIATIQMGSAINYGVPFV